MQWIKPKKWGGYDTAKGFFYIEEKNGKKHHEYDYDWESVYAKWINGDKKYSLFGIDINRKIGYKQSMNWKLFHWRNRIIGALIQIFQGCFTLITLGLSDRDFHCDWCEHCLRRGIAIRKALMDK